MITFYIFLQLTSLIIVACQWNCVTTKIGDEFPHMIDSAIMMGCVLGWSRSWVALLPTGTYPKPLPTGPAEHDERGRLVGFMLGIRLSVS